MWKSLGNEDIIHILAGSISSIQALSQSANKKHIWKNKKKQPGNIKLGGYKNEFKKLQTYFLKANLRKT